MTITQKENYTFMYSMLDNLTHTAYTYCRMDLKGVVVWCNGFIANTILQYGQGNFTYCFIFGKMTLQFFELGVDLKGSKSLSLMLHDILVHYGGIKNAWS